MAKEPGRRYQNAQEMTDDLARHLAGQPIEARPVGRVERTWRLCRRNPVVAGLSAAVVLVLASGIVASAYFAADAISQSKRADQRAGEALASAETAKKAEARADQNAKDALQALSGEETARKQEQLA